MSVLLFSFLERIKFSFKICNLDLNFVKVKVKVNKKKIIHYK